MTVISPSIIKEFEQLLGKKSILFSESDCNYYLQNVSALKRNISGILLPKTTEEVQSIVSLANRHKIPLYPISTGKNWGLGSKLPVKDGAVIVDLSQMNRIHEINEEFGYAIIEPGVTQQQLYKAIQQSGLDYMFNVTGSGSQTSILGNALDRGVGYLATRAEDILNLEVVLGNGQIMQTGFGHYPHALTQHLYKYGVGPDIQGLFVQSNFGIVTKATFELKPLQEQQAAILCGLKHAHQFEAFVDELASLRKNEVIRTAFHIGNKERFRSTVVPQLEEILAGKHQMSAVQANQLAEKTFDREIRNIWSALGTLAGSRKVVKATYQIIKKRMNKFGKVSLITDHKLRLAKKIFTLLSFSSYFSLKLPFLKSFEAVYGLTKGIPTDIPLKALSWQHKLQAADFREPDHGPLGLLFVTPLIPLNGKSAWAVQELTNKIFQKYGFPAYITLNMCTSKSLEGVINVFFDKRNPKEVQAAHECIEVLTLALKEKGYIPYRVGIQAMDAILDETDNFWQTIKALKKVLDPNQIISPGRYNLV